PNGVVRLVSTYSARAAVLAAAADGEGAARVKRQCSAELVIFVAVGRLQITRLSPARARAAEEVDGTPILGCVVLYRVEAPSSTILQRGTDGKEIAVGGQRDSHCELIVEPGIGGFDVRLL